MPTNAVLLDAKDLYISYVDAFGPLSDLHHLPWERLSQRTQDAFCQMVEFASHGLRSGDQTGYFSGYFCFGCGDPDEEVVLCRKCAEACAWGVESFCVGESR